MRKLEYFILEVICLWWILYIVKIQSFDTDHYLFFLSAMVIYGLLGYYDGKSRDGESLTLFNRGGKIDDEDKD